MERDDTRAREAGLCSPPDSQSVPLQLPQMPFRPPAPVVSHEGVVFSGCGLVTVHLQRLARWRLAVNRWQLPIDRWRLPGN